MANTNLSAFIRWLKRRKVVVLLLVFSFIVSGLIINLLQFFTLPLYFLKRRWFRIINAKIVYFHWCVLPWSLITWACYDIKVYTEKNGVDVFANTEHALCLLNHPGDLDWMIGWVLIERIGMLGGTKAIMKDVAKWLPGIGWTFLFMEYPFLKRDWKQDEATLADNCRNLADYPVNMLLCLFAEGTRFTKEKHKRSMEFARSRGLPILKHHLIPRTKGFCFIMNHLKHAIPAIYDITICYRDGEPTIMGVIDAEPCAADVLIRRFPTADIPSDSDEDLADWLIKLYQEKDELVEYHKKHKRFPEKEAYLPKRIWPDVVTAMWILLLGIPAFVSALYLAWVGAWFTLGLIILAVVLADQLFQHIARAVNMRESSSSYGLDPLKKTTNDGSDGHTENTNRTKKAD